MRSVQVVPVMGWASWVGTDPAACTVSGAEAPDWGAAWRGGARIETCTGIEGETLGAGAAAGRGTRPPNNKNAVMSMEPSPYA